jgi:hypothetical protein
MVSLLARRRRTSVRITLSAKNGVSLTRNRNCFSPTGTTFTSVAATAVALRGVDQCHFAEDALFRKCSENPIAAPDLDATALDDEHLMARLAFIEDHFASLEGLLRTRFRQQAEVKSYVRHVPLPNAPRMDRRKFTSKGRLVDERI